MFIMTFRRKCVIPGYRNFVPALLASKDTAVRSGTPRDVDGVKPGVRNSGYELGEFICSHGFLGRALMLVRSVGCSSQTHLVPHSPESGSSLTDMREWRTATALASVAPSFLSCNPGGGVDVHQYPTSIMMQINSRSCDFPHSYVSLAEMTLSQSMLRVR